MVSYIIALFFAILGVLTAANNIAPSELVMTLTFWTVAALVATAQHVENKRQSSIKAHPSRNQQDTQVYDWKKDDWGKEA